MDRKSYVVDICSILLGDIATYKSSKFDKESLRLTIQGFGSHSNVKLAVTGERIKAEKILHSRNIERR